MGFTSRFNRKNKVSPNNEDPSPAVSPWINSPATGEKLTEVFKSFDMNCDGKISAPELNSTLSSLENGVTTEELEKMFSEVDSDGDGLINFEEFLYCNGILEDIRGSFSVFDVDESGFITAVELQTQFKKILDVEYSIEDCQKQIDARDSDGDHRMSYEEFRGMLVCSRFGGGNAGRARPNS